MRKEAEIAVTLYTSIFNRSIFGKNAVQTLLAKNNFIEERFYNISVGFKESVNTAHECHDTKWEQALRG